MLCTIQKIDSFEGSGMYIQYTYSCLDSCLTYTQEPFNVPWSIFCGEFDLDYFGKYALEQLPFLRIARAMCYLCMGRVLDWERLHKICSDEFCDPTKIFTGRTAEALPGLVDYLAKFHSTC